MKESQDHNAQEQLDLLLFNYLEGELSDEQKEALNARLGKELDLQVEMECWMDSVVEQDFYNTEQLERNLMEIPAKPWYAALYFNVFLGMLLIGMFSFLPLSKREEAAMETFESKNLLQEQRSIEEQGLILAPVSPAPAPLVKMLSLEETIEKPITKAAVKEEIIPEKYLVHYFPTISRLVPEEITFLSTPLAPVAGLKKVRVEKKRTRSVSRKEARKIAKMKDKALQERMAREFMKGKRAYVVPLDTKNF